MEVSDFFGYRWDKKDRMECMRALKELYFRWEVPSETLVEMAEKGYFDGLGKHTSSVRAVKDFIA